MNKFLAILFVGLGIVAGVQGGNGIAFWILGGVAYFGMDC